MKRKPRLRKATGNTFTRPLVAEAERMGWTAELTQHGHYRFRKPGYRTVTMSSTPKNEYIAKRRVRSQLLNARPA